MKYFFLLFVHRYQVHVSILAQQPISKQQAGSTESKGFIMGVFLVRMKKCVSSIRRILFFLADFYNIHTHSRNLMFTHSNFIRNHRLELRRAPLHMFSPSNSRVFFNTVRMEADHQVVQCFNHYMSEIQLTLPIKKLSWVLKCFIDGSARLIFIASTKLLKITQKY